MPQHPRYHVRSRFRPGAGFPKRVLTKSVPTVAAAVLITVFALVRQQSFLKTLPTLITLVVQAMMARANRYGFLLGGCNSVLYGIGYLSEGLYFSAGSAILFSFPMQIYSFFQWKRHAKGTAVSFRTLSRRNRCLTLLGILSVWGGCLFFLPLLFSDASFPVPDAYLFVSGIAVTVLSAERYLESQYLSVVSSAVSIVLYVLMVLRDPADMNYLIISVYNLCRTVEAAVCWTKLYINQKKEKSP